MNSKLSLLITFIVAPAMVFGSSVAAQAAGSEPQDVSENMSVSLPAMNLGEGERLFEEELIRLGDFKGYYRVQVSGFQNLEIVELDLGSKPVWETHSDGTLSMTGPEVLVKRALAGLSGLLSGSNSCGSATFSFQPLPEPAEDKGKPGKPDAENPSKDKDQGNSEKQQSDETVDSTENETTETVPNDPGASDLPEIILTSNAIGCVVPEMNDNL
jgi:hypothetical protein